MPARAYYPAIRIAVTPVPAACAHSVLSGISGGVVFIKWRPWHRHSMTSVAVAGRGARTRHTASTPSRWRAPPPHIPAAHLRRLPILPASRLHCWRHTTHLRHTHAHSTPRPALRARAAVSSDTPRATPHALPHIRRRAAPQLLCPFTYAFYTPPPPHHHTAPLQTATPAFATLHLRAPYAPRRWLRAYATTTRLPSCDTLPPHTAYTTPYCTAPLHTRIPALHQTHARAAHPVRAPAYGSRHRPSAPTLTWTSWIS